MPKKRLGAEKIVAISFSYEIWLNARISFTINMIAANRVSKFNLLFSGFVSPALLLEVAIS